MLQHFWDLASLDPQDRARAVQRLVTDLLASQADHAAAAGSGSGDDLPAAGRQPDQKPAPPVRGDAAAALAAALGRCSPLMAYALKRLARGLASSRDGARQGYAAALAVLLAHAAGNGAAAAAVGNAQDGGAGRQQHKKLKQQHVGGGGWMDLGGALSLIESSLQVTGSMKGSVSHNGRLWLGGHEEGRRGGGIGEGGRGGEKLTGSRDTFRHTPHICTL